MGDQARLHRCGFEGAWGGGAVRCLYLIVHARCAVGAGAHKELGVQGVKISTVTQSPDDAAPPGQSVTRELLAVTWRLRRPVASGHPA